MGSLKETPSMLSHNKFDECKIYFYTYQIIVNFWMYFGKNMFLTVPQIIAKYDQTNIQLYTYG